MRIYLHCSVQFLRWPFFKTTFGDLLKIQNVHETRLLCFENPPITWSLNKYIVHTTTHITIFFSAFTTHEGPSLPISIFVFLNSYDIPCNTAVSTIPTYIFLGQPLFPFPSSLPKKGLLSLNNITIYKYINMYIICDKRGKYDQRVP